MQTFVIRIDRHELTKAPNLILPSLCLRQRERRTMRSGTGLIQRRSKRQCERSFSSSKALPGNISRRTSSRRTCYTSVRAFPFLSSPTASVHKHSPRFLFSSLLILTAFSFSHVLLTARQIRVELSARRQRARRVTEGRGAGLEEEAAGSVAKQVKF